MYKKISNTPQPAQRVDIPGSGKARSSAAVPALQQSTVTQHQIADEATASIQRKIEDELSVQGKFTMQRLGIPEEEILQGRFNPAKLEENKTGATQHRPFQLKNNDTGMPDTLKSGLESMSGFDLSDVKVHHNSDKPAQLNAHAYAQGSEIHLAPGQEKHLPHEAWHVVQQRQGRVQPTMQMKQGVPVNDDPALENEADIMGAQALQHQSALVTKTNNVPVNPASLQLKAASQTEVLQAMWQPMPHGQDVDGATMRYDNLEETQGLQWYYKIKEPDSDSDTDDDDSKEVRAKARSEGEEVMMFTIDGANPHAELIKHKEGQWGPRTDWEELWSRVNWAKDPTVVMVPMRGVQTVADSFTTLRSEGFAGCIGLIMLQGNQRTLAHVFSGHIEDPQQWSNFDETKAKAATANTTYIFYPGGTYSFYRGSKVTEKFINDFGIQGNIIFRYNNDLSVQVSPTGIVAA